MYSCGLYGSQEPAIVGPNPIAVLTFGDDGFAKANEVTAWQGVIIAGRAIAPSVGYSICYFVSVNTCATRHPAKGNLGLKNSVLLLIRILLTTTIAHRL